MSFDSDKNKLRAHNYDTKFIVVMRTCAVIKES